MSIDIAEQYDKIYRYCCYRLHRRELAEDITQETFLRFLGHGGYSGRGESIRILYTIARNLCIDEARRGKREFLTGEEPFFAGETSAAEEETILARTALFAAMERLDEEERELVFLRYVNEVPVQALARLYGISRFALYRRCEQALKKLRRELEG